MSTIATLLNTLVAAPLDLCIRQGGVRGHGRPQKSQKRTSKISRKIHAVRVGSGSYATSSGQTGGGGTHQTTSSAWTAQDQHRWRAGANPDSSYSSRYSPRASFRGTPSSRNSASHSPRKASDVSRVYEINSSEPGNSSRAPVQTFGASAHSPLPELRPSAEQVLRNAMLEVVPALQEAPFLYIEYKHSNRREGVPDSMVSAPQLWHGIAESLGQEEPKTIVFVRKVEGDPTPSAGVPCPREITAASSSSASPSSLGINSASMTSATTPTSTSKPHPAASVGSSDVAPADTAQLKTLFKSHKDPNTIATKPRMEWATPKSEAKLSAKSLTGQVGDCCSTHDAPAGDSAVEEQETSPSIKPLPNKHSGARAQEEGSQACSCSGSRSSSSHGPVHHKVEVVDVDPEAPFGRGTKCECSAARGDALDVWGVVVQSKECPAADGCYILTTCRAETGTGCSCTRFALQRASCGGASIAQQMDDMWLS